MAGARPGEEEGPRQSSKRCRSTDIATGGRMLSTHRSVTRLAGLLVVASFVFAACSSAGTRAPRIGGVVGAAIGGRVGRRLGAARRTVGRRSAADMDALIAAAKAEGGLTTIALPRDWCNYGERSSTASRQVRHPDQRAQPRWRLGGRARGDQGQQGQPGPAGAGRRRRRPRRSARRASTEGLFQPYKVATWDTIPDAAKDGRRHVVRRLLRRHVVRGQHQGRHRTSRRTGPTC